MNEQNKNDSNKTQTHTISTKFTTKDNTTQITTNNNIDNDQNAATNAAYHQIFNKNAEKNTEMFDKFINQLDETDTRQMNQSQKQHIQGVNPINTVYNIANINLRKRTFDISDKYIDNCTIIYNTLSQIFHSVESQIIAEYASTLYTQCVECGDKYGFIECYKDYWLHEDSKVIAVFDENDNARYYVDDEPLFWSQCQQDDTLDEEVEILCLNCALKWKCTICKKQILQQNQQEICICNACKSTVCCDCVIDIVKQQYSNINICKNCNSDNNGNDQPDKWGTFTFE
eukprot:241143_1